MSFTLRSLLLAVVLHTATHAAAPPPLLRDAFGDPLPPGAVARFGTTRLRHGGIQQLAYTRNGKSLLSYGGFGANELRLWDTATGKLIQRRRFSPFDMTEHVAISPNGDAYLVGSQGVYHIKDLQSLKKKIHEQADFNPTSAHVSPDGKLLAVRTVTGGFLLEVPGGKVALNLDASVGQGGQPFDLAFSPDGTRFAIGKASGEIILWDVAARKKLHTYPTLPGAGPGSLPTCRWSFSADGRFLLAWTNGKFRMLETAAPREVAGFVAPNDMIVQAAFSADGKQLLAIDNTGTIRRYVAATGKEFSTTPLSVANRETVFQAVFAADRKTVAVVENSNIYIVDVKTGQSTTKQLGDRQALHQLRWSPRGEVVGLSVGNSIQVWDPRTGKTLRAETLANDESILDVDHEGKLALIQKPEHPPTVVRLADKKELWKADEHGMANFSGQFSPDGRWVVTSNGSNIEVREARTGKVRRSWAASLESSSSSTILTWSADGRAVAVVGDGVKIREFATGKIRRMIEGEFLTATAFCPRGAHLATVGMNNLIRVHRLTDGKPVFEVVTRGSTGGAMNLGLGGLGLGGVGGLGGLGGLGAGLGTVVPSVAVSDTSKVTFSPDGRFLVAACGEVVRVWDMTGKPVGVFQGHEEDLLDLTFAPDGRTLITASDDGTALVWDMNHLNRVKLSPSLPPPDEALWADLASDDAERADRAMARLRWRPAAAVEFLAARLTPARPLDAKVMGGLLLGLEADTAAERRRAAESLQALDVQAEADLKKLATATRSAEVRRAVARLLAQIDGPSEIPERVREIRAVEVLEAVGDAAAKALLQRLAKGADARLTREAKEALARLRWGK